MLLEINLGLDGCWRHFGTHVQ